MSTQVATAPSVFKRPYNIEAQPIDFTLWLPSGVLLATATASAVINGTSTSAAIVAAAVIRTGKQIVDVVLTGGSVGVIYRVSLQVVTDAAAGATQPRKEISFLVYVL